MFVLCGRLRSTATNFCMLQHLKPCKESFATLVTLKRSLLIMDPFDMPVKHCDRDELQHALIAIDDAFVGPLLMNSQRFLSGKENLTLICAANEFV